jgi:hypothetical protein
MLAKKILSKIEQENDPLENVAIKSIKHIHEESLNKTEESTHHE